MQMQMIEYKLKLNILKLNQSIVVIKQSLKG